jgi:hypothetical protein
VGVVLLPLCVWAVPDAYYVDSENCTLLTAYDAKKCVVHFTITTIENTNVSKVNV